MTMIAVPAQPIAMTQHDFLQWDRFTQSDQDRFNTRASFMCSEMNLDTVTLGEVLSFQEDPRW